MDYYIDNNDLQNLNIDNFEKIMRKSDPKDYDEYMDVPGKQHYKLLSYFSTLFNNSNIIDIGTHRGHSALALSYNDTNMIYTFDIVNNVCNPEIRYKKNISFHLEDLFSTEVQNRWEHIIMSCPFIFLDVDPHNGDMEIEFYNYLKRINYPGFVICDDIWFFKEMRDNFWYKIPEEFRYDLSEHGHWSGTGVFTFNKDIKFPKRDNTNWTLVTAYFNLTRCPDASEKIIARDAKYYFSHSVSTLCLPYNLVIYCDAESEKLIKKMRPDYLKSKTKYIVREFDDFKFNKDIELRETFADYRNIINENRIKNPYQFDNRNTASYYLFCMSRYIMLKEVIELNPFQSSHFCWINFCIERMGYQNLMKLDEALNVKRDLFSTCYIDYVPEPLVNNTSEYFLWGRCGMCSGFFTGNAKYMYAVCDLIENKFLEYLKQGYGHADEQLYSPVYFQNGELFEHYYGDYQQMITNYKYIYMRTRMHRFITL